jgi:hypothetical protein
MEFFDGLGMLEGLRGLFQDFNAGIFLGLASALYIVINVLRGKAGFNVPWITKQFNKIKSKAGKNAILLALFGLAGGLTTLNSADPTVWLFLDGVLAGISLGVGTIGSRHVIKSVADTDTVKSMATKMSKLVKKDDK